MESCPEESANQEASRAVGTKEQTASHRDVTRACSALLWRRRFWKRAPAKLLPTIGGEIKGRRRFAGTQGGRADALECSMLSWALSLLTTGERRRNACVLFT